MRIVRKIGSLLVLKHDILSLIQQLLTGLFIASLGLYMTYAVLTEYAKEPSALFLLMTLILGASTCVGLYCIFSSLSEGFIIIEMDKDAGKMLYSRTGLLAKEHVKCDLNDIISVDFIMAISADYDGSCYGVLTTKDRIFDLHPDVIAGFGCSRRIVNEISDFLNLPRSDET